MERHVDADIAAGGTQPQDRGGLLDSLRGAIDALGFGDARVVEVHLTARQAGCTLSFDSDETAPTVAGAVHDAWWKAASSLDIEGRVTALRIESFEEVQSFLAVNRMPELVGAEEVRQQLEGAAGEGLVGVAEVADLMQVSRQRVSSLRRDNRLPPPIAELAAGPVWTRAAVDRFLESRLQRAALAPPGRRRPTAAG